MRSKVLFVAVAVLFVATAMGERPEDVKVSRSDKVSQYEVLDKLSIPQQINYQGYLTDAEGNQVDGVLEMIFSIWDAATGGAQLWSETQSSVVVTNGLFNVLLGSVNPIPMAIFTGAPRWLQTQVGTEVLMSRKTIVSVAYVFRALVADNASYAVTASNADTAGFALHAKYADSTGVEFIVIGPDTIIGSSNSPILTVTNTGTGPGLKGKASGYSGQGVYGYADGTYGSGVYGEVAGNAGYGVRGRATGQYGQGVYGVATGSEGEGMYGLATDSSGKGVYGKNNESGNYGYLGTNDCGVYGKNNNYGNYGMLGHVGYGVWGSNQGFNTYGWIGGEYGVYGEDDDNSNRGYLGSYHYGAYGKHWASGNYGYLGGTSYGVYASGDMGCSGTKPAVVRTSRGPTEMYAMESPELWFEDFGSARLTNGRAHITLDRHFLETVTIEADNPMKVFVQLNDDCNGVYVKKGIDGFEVIELQGGTSNASFDYRVLAKRKGYETQRMKVVEYCYTDRFLYPDDNNPSIPLKWREQRQKEGEAEEKIKESPK